MSDGNLPSERLPHCGDGKVGSDVTEVRFGMRSMLIAVAVVAVVATALGAFIRHFPKDARLPLAIYWGVLAAILMALCAFSARRRYVAELKAGRTLFQLMPHNYFLPRAPGFARVCAAIFMLAAGPGLWVAYSFRVASAAATRSWLQEDLDMFYALALSATGISYLWWRRIRLTENGLILRNRFIPWSDCFRWYWDACNKNVVVIATPQRSSIAMRVPPEDRAAIETLLKERVPARRLRQLTAGSIQ